MPHGTPTPKLIPEGTKLSGPTRKISMRCRVEFVRYSSFWLALKIASAIFPPSGSANVRPATTTTVSMPLLGVAARGRPRGGGGAVDVLGCEEAQVPAPARAAAEAPTTAPPGEVLV